MADDDHDPVPDHHHGGPDHDDLHDDVDDHLDHDEHDHHDGGPDVSGGRVELSNGTCAVSVQCTDIGCSGCIGTATGSYCRTGGPVGACTTDDSCPTGQFCVTELGIFVCAAAC
jgi:hypothetical protein